jgi:hypothetical protein
MGHQMTDVIPCAALSDGETRIKKDLRVCCVLNHRPVNAQLYFFGGIALRGQCMAEMCSFEIVDVQRMISLYRISSLNRQNRPN